MASSIASARPNLAAPVDEDAANDPFVTSTSSAVHHRFSAFDHELFAAGPGSSPRQAKRALEAHIAETERRLDEAGKLGTALVSQRKALAEQLQEIDKLQAQGELGPELRQKLVEIEREYNDLARESARAFLPKRIPSNENGPATPYAPDGRTGRRSISPSKFDGHATGSPTKLTVPKRRARNQQSNRIHDIEFAAEISQSLIAQVRNLQSLLSEREEEVKTLQGEKSRLEIDTEGLYQRLKTLDESEHRYKDENWNLETRMQEMTSLQKEASDKEKKLSQALGLAKMEKTVAQKELDEVKASHAKLTEDHAAAMKLHDIELGSAKRNLTLGEDERTSLQKKIDDLTGQNQELARAFSAQRGRLMNRELGSGLSDEDFDTATENATPEHSPPPSPIKGTPRHAVLETETVKTSLGHAQRTIQSQRNQLHREKTEKLELRRIIQDLRDDLDKLRVDAGGNTSANRRRKVDSKEFKRPSKLLGSMRSGKHEIFLDDPEWEENDGNSPTGSPTAARRSILPSTEPSDHFETANEASESAFETANERATETDDFQTGHEDMSDSDGAATETESRGFGRMKQTPNLPAGLARLSSRESFHSTASTSADEALDILPDVRTPTGTVSSTRSRFSLSRLPWSRRSRQNSEEPAVQSSPVSHAGSAGTPRVAGQSLFAELQDFDGSEDESVGGTPRTRTVRSVTPGSTRRTLSPAPPMPRRAVMVDSSTMTEPFSVLPQTVEAIRPTSSGSVIYANRELPEGRSSYATTTETDASRPASALSNSDMHEEIARFPIPPNAVTPKELAFSSMQTQYTEPREAFASEVVEPIASPPRPIPVMSLGQIQSEVVEPIEPPSPKTPKALAPVAIAAPVPQLSLSTIKTQDIAPTALPQPVLGYSSIATEGVSPVSEPLPVLPALGFSSVRTEHTMPVSPAKVRTPQLMLSSISSEAIQPRMAPKSRPTLSFSTIQSVNIEPQSPRNERRNGFILPRQIENTPEKPTPETPTSKLFGTMFGRGKGKDASPTIAEDETRQSPSDSPHAETPESQRPFKEISANSSTRPPRKSVLRSTNDQGAQTALTSGAIDRLQKGHAKSPSVASVGSPATMGTVRIHRSQESLASHINRGVDFDDSMYDTGSVIIRPGSAASGRRSVYETAPPLPTNHRQAIQAAGSQTQTNMGPPLWPASAMKRPSTPSQRGGPGSAYNGTPTPRAARTGVFVDFQPKTTAIGRQPSVSSFASDIDARFDLQATDMDPTGFGPNTDPRMIQAITQTMIGEYLWKYTRKTGRGELSANRHRRYFWVHPYTRTLYWGDQDPSSAGRSELKAKSVPIEAVRVVTDDNPMPPGLHRKSLVIIAPGRTIKFTCPTGQRHETWFNALSYLLVRTEPQATYDAEDVADSITREDVDEFNPQFGRRRGHGNRPEQQSVSSYNSRTVRNESPAEVYSMAVPTLTPSARRTALANKASKGTLNKISGYWKLSSLRSRAGGSNVDLYSTNQVHDSAEDLRELIERQDRDADRLENVRACCDGKHDVGSVPHSSKRHRHSHAHPARSANTTPVSSTRTRA
ncbi:nuclear migration protein (ApsA), putative [Cordyceps militaris CM01]|uniref:Nuclear migration protein (ApsA), putative n=1 Tax=Cordyceps militaris (strain CM01) TaxID=983644 RepID=G3JMR2_CORMM|nr:nuclear migration protein (ApsA), putative [Cordyceps militaris CM01]EGX90094.1 nuclear migration protein (ApsA), putative [Cordyceps militaris CM01]